tara:strand:- start:641 stop:1969 length:1329 start_codon:yes stop_codon:yes gene_type:complete
MKNFVKINSKIPSFKKEINVPGDKSISIRWVLLASKAFGKSKAYNLLESDDVKSTIKAMQNLGVKIKKKNNFYEIYGCGLKNYRNKKNITIDAGNSGTLARLICGLLSNYNHKVKIIGDESLSKRDFYRVIEPLKQFGVNISSRSGKLPVNISGNSDLRPIDFEEHKGSAQVKSSILLAALNTPGITTIKCPPSRNHTEIMFKNCLKIPIKIVKKKKYEIIQVEGLKNFRKFDYKIPGDISSASFFIVLTLLSKGSRLKIRNVNINPSRIGIIEILRKMNGKINLSNKRIYKGEQISDIIIESTKNLKSINCPKNLNTKSIDEFLIIFLLCARAKGISRFKGIQELRHKESDRLKMASKFLRMLGIKVKVSFDSISIYGKPDLILKKKYVVKNFMKDHRVFMMATIAANVFGGNFKIYDKSSIKSSFPNFLQILKGLGSKIN